MIKEPLKANYARKTITNLDRRDHISRKELIKEYIEPSIPVILTDAADSWKAMGKVTPDFIKNKYGHLTKEVNGVIYTFSEFIDLMLTSTPEKPAPYPFNLNVEHYFPELLKDAQPEIIYGKSDRINHPLLPRSMMLGTEVYELFLGGNGAFFPVLHYDALCLHNQMTQLYGSKDFILYSPEQTPYLYPKEDNPKISRVDIFNPDYDKYPLFKKAEPIKATIKQGDTILFPTGWWHSTQIHEPCISFGRVQLNASNWNAYINDEYQTRKKKNSLLAIAALTYGKLLGQIMNLQEKFA